MVPFLGPSGGTKNENAKSQNQQQRPTRPNKNYNCLFKQKAYRFGTEEFFSVQRLSPGRLSSRKDNCILQIHRINAVAIHFSICACHPCAGAMLIFSVSFQFYRMIPEGNPYRFGTEEARTCETWFQLTFRPQKWNLKAHMWYQLSPLTGSNVAIAMQHDLGNIQHQALSSPGFPLLSVFICSLPVLLCCLSWWCSLSSSSCAAHVHFFVFSRYGCFWRGVVVRLRPHSLAASLP